ncbi:MAG TPA: ABC transporter ATP-binding protein [Candidatus Kapabacteria bacterium]|nr:ABC transporter ATP-binding protein [Candidatus Kapabacteria bacterium]
MDLSLRIDDVSKRFTRKLIFEPVTAEVYSGEIVAITGKNGAGKSTLLKIISQTLPASRGKCDWYSNSMKLDADDIRMRMGYVAPYLELYGELTAVEHLQFVATLHGKTLESAAAIIMLEETGLPSQALSTDRPLRAFSSGMRQRVKLAMATCLKPDVLLLDEATSNLDEGGIQLVTDIVKSAADRGAIVILATNEDRELALASKQIEILPYTPRN